MPRISAPTVVEHHARRRRALLDAARELLSESPDVPAMADVGRRAGLARSSVYQYFPSAQDLFSAVVEELFTGWSERIRELVDAAPTPALKVWTYVRANVDAIAVSEQAVARALTRAIDPHLLQAPMQRFHTSLQVPLRQALEALGDPEPRAMADLVDQIVVTAAKDLAADPATVETTKATILARLRRLLAGYLGLTDTDLP